ncbi:hypothetical protein D3C78_20260 [compost metagenome]
MTNLKLKEVMINNDLMSMKIGTHKIFRREKEIIQLQFQVCTLDDFGQKSIDKVLFGPNAKVYSTPILHLSKNDLTTFIEVYLHYVDPESDHQQTLICTMQPNNAIYLTYEKGHYF